MKVRNGAVVGANSASVAAIIWMLGGGNGLGAQVSEDVLLGFLSNGLIDVGGDDAKFDKIREASADLADALVAEPAKTVSFALVGFDPEVPADEPGVREALAALRDRWATYVNTFSGPPVTVVRAMLLSALTVAAEKDDGVALAFVAVARNSLPFVGVESERDIWVAAVRAAEARVDARAEREWATPASIDVAPMNLDLPDLGAPTFERATVDIEALKTSFWAAAGPQYVDPRRNNAINTGGNPHWPQSTSHWNGEFGTRLASAVAETIDGVLSESAVEQADLTEPFRAVAAAFSEHIDAVLGSVSAATAGLQRRTALLWWKEALFSPSSRRSYRDMPHPAAAAVMAFDLYRQVPAFAPLSVYAFLAEAVLGLPGIESEKTYPLRELVGRAQDDDALSELREFGSTRVPAPDGRGPLLGLIAHPDTVAARSEERFHRLTGLPPGTPMTLPAWAGWVFRELQAVTATAGSRKA
jgi:GTPase-associated system-like protein